MELIRMENRAEFRTYLAKLRDQGVAAYLSPLRPYQYLYYLIKKQARIGFVDIHYSPGRPDARIGMIYLENRYRSLEMYLELMPMIEEKAKKLGALTLEQTYTDNPEVLLQSGWNIAVTSYILQKKL